jgi:hypothetical protein
MQNLTTSLKVGPNSFTVFKNLANSRKYIVRKLFILAIIILSGCDSKQVKQTPLRPKTSNHENNLKEPDTTTLLWRLTTEREIELSSLLKRNRKEYARSILKQFAFCNCLYQALKSDSTFYSVDNSNGFLARDMVVHSNDVVDSISSVVEEYVSAIHNDYEPSSSKPVSLMCLDLYESAFLDSLVKHYDSEILKEVDRQ